MSTSSTKSRHNNRRIDSLQNNGHISQEAAYSTSTHKRIVNHNDAYLYALRVAYLAHLLQPRARRTQHIPAPTTAVQRSSTSINDLMKDFSLIRDSKSTRFPHGFIAELEKRLTGVLMGKEKKPEYNDAAVKRTFAAFFNAFSEPSFKKRMEKDRRAEDLVLIFFSNATKELSKGKSQGDDAWKLMVDRHLALFVRLVSLVLKDHEWNRDRPELTGRLATLETKLLAHDQDLTASPARNGSQGGPLIEVVAPTSYDVKDMPLVQVVGKIFALKNSMMQSDINKNKPVWTEKAALQDLKTYQTLLNLDSRKTLRNEDFDLDESYDVWKKGEVQDLSQMMLAVVQANPGLAKSTTGSLPQLNQHANNNGEITDPQYPDALRKINSHDASSYVIDQPVDMSALSSGSQTPDVSSDADTFTFMPPDPRNFYRFVLAQTLTHDLSSQDVRPASSEGENGSPPVTLLSKQSTEMLNELCLRWRIPYVSRMILFLDVIREKFVDQEITLDTLDAAFIYVKDPLPEKSKNHKSMTSILFERSNWPLADTVLKQQILSSLHVALLRDLFDSLQHCYEQKPPSVGPLVYVLENNIYNDPGFSKTPEELSAYRDQLHQGLQQKAHEMYRAFLQKEVPNDQHSWDFAHVIDLGKAVVALAQRIQKRYKKNPEVMGYGA